MNILLFIFTSWSIYASEPLSWSYINSVKDIHEFYQQNEVITKPQDAWQMLFSLHYTDGEFKSLKDCVYFRVPGGEAGILKIKTLHASVSCDDHILSPGTKEVPNIKSLQYMIFPSEVQLDFTLSDFKAEKWTADIKTSKNISDPKMQTSSAEYKKAKVILLAPTQNVSVKASVPLQQNSLCHDINDDCAETRPSTCSQCPEGWYEIPNGCSDGPKHCGILDCGGKNKPACRRGMKWQRTEETQFDCRTNSSFAYCRKELSVICEGKKAFCR